MAVTSISGRKPLYVGGKYTLVNREGVQFECKLIVSLVGDLVFATKDLDGVACAVPLFNAINNRWTILDSLELKD